MKQLGKLNNLKYSKEHYENWNYSYLKFIQKNFFKDQKVSETNKKKSSRTNFAAKEREKKDDF